MAPRPVAASQIKSVRADLAAIGGNRPFTDRLGDAVKAFGSVFFGPLVPSTPSKDIQAEGPRRWPFMPGYNAHITPRGSEGLTPFSTLVNISQLYDTAAMCILYRVEEISAMDWTVVDLDPHHPASDQEKADYAAFLAKPDGITQLEDWLAALVEEILVTDALSVYMPRSRTNQILGFELVDGTTIRTLADGHGRQPQPPSPSHQQIINGRIAWEGTTQDFMYAPKNRRVRSLYGRSPTENLVLGINRALRRQVFDLAYYAEGNIPEALVPVGDLTPDQLDDLQAWFDGIAGQPEQVRRVHLIPATTGRITPFEFKRPILDEKVELFLDKRCMAMYGITSGSLGFDPGTQGTGALQENVSYQRSIALTRFVRRIIHSLMTEYRTSQPSQAFGSPKSGPKKWNCRIQLKGEEPEEDKVRQSSVDHTYWSMGKVSVNELRKRDGEDPIEGMDDPFVMLPTGPVDLKLALQAAQGNGGMPPVPAPPEKLGPDGKPVKNPAEEPGQGPGSDKEAPGERSDDGKPASGMPSKIDTTSLIRYSEDQPRDDHGRFGTSEERQAEIESLKAEHHAVLMTPLMSTGEISPMQVGMMSKNEHARYMENTMQKMDIEARIRQLSKSDEELAKDKNTASVRDLRSRQSQLTSQIEMWDRLSQNKYRGVTGSVKSKAATHERLKTELADVRAKITTLDPKGLVRVDESGDEGTQLLRTVNSWLERDISTADGLTNHDLQGGTPTPSTGDCGCPEGEPCDCGVDCPDCGPNCCPQVLERSSVDPLPLPTQPYMTNSAGKRIPLPGDVTNKLNTVIQMAAEGGFSGVTLVGSFANGDSDKGGEGTSDIDVLLHPLEGLEDGDSRAQSVEDSLNADGRPVEISVGPYLSIDMEGWTPCYVTLWGSTDVQAASDMVGDQPKVGPPIGYPSPATGPVDAVSRRAEVTVDPPNVPTRAEGFGTTSTPTPESDNLSRADFFTDETGVHPIRGAEGYSGEKAGDPKGSKDSKDSKGSKSEPMKSKKETPKVGTHDVKAANGIAARVQAELKNGGDREAEINRIGGIVRDEIESRLPKDMAAKIEAAGKLDEAIPQQDVRAWAANRDLKAFLDEHTDANGEIRLTGDVASKFDELSKASNEAYQQLRDMKAESAALHAEADATYRETTLQVLSEIRPLGLGANTPTPQLIVGGEHLVDPEGWAERDRAAGEAVRQAWEVFPRDWLEHSGDPAPRASIGAVPEDKMLAVMATDRGQYNHWGQGHLDPSGRVYGDEYPGLKGTKVILPGTPTMQISGKGDYMYTVAVHEMGHRMESVVPGIKDLEKQFYERRTAGEEVKQLGQGFGENEVGRADHFADPYMGKDYGGSAYELLSMGVEATLGKGDTYGIRTKDPDFHRFILGTLAAGGRK